MLVSPDDAEALERSIGHVASSPEAREQMVQRGLAQAVRFTGERCAERRPWPCTTLRSAAPEAQQPVDRHDQPAHTRTLGVLASVGSVGDAYDNAWPRASRQWSWPRPDLEDAAQLELAIVRWARWSSHDASREARRPAPN